MIPTDGRSLPVSPRYEQPEFVHPRLRLDVIRKWYVGGL